MADAELEHYINVKIKPIIIKVQLLAVGSIKFEEGFLKV
jgi:hypothetical protein